MHKTLSNIRYTELSSFSKQETDPHATDLQKLFKVNQKLCEYNELEYGNQIKKNHYTTQRKGEQMCIYKGVGISKG